MPTNTLDPTRTNKDLFNSVYQRGLQLNRNFEDADVDEQLSLAAHAYLYAYVGSTQFLLDLKRRVANGLPLTVPQIRGTLNYIMLDAQARIRAKQVVVKQPEVKQPVKQTLRP